jgi:hypothetical protein
MFSWRTSAGVLLAFVVFEVVLRQLTFGHVTLDPRVGWMWRSTTVVHRLGEGWGVTGSERLQRYPSARSERTCSEGTVCA